MATPNQDWCFPVFVVDGADVIVVHDTADVRRKLEPFLADEHIEFFDGAGQRLRMSVDRGRMAFVAIAGDAEVDLVRILSRYLVATGRAVPIEPDTRSFVVSAANAIDPKR